MYYLQRGHCQICFVLLFLKFFHLEGKVLDKAELLFSQQGASPAERGARALGPIPSFPAGGLGGEQGPFPSHHLLGRTGEEGCSGPRSMGPSSPAGRTPSHVPTQRCQSPLAPCYTYGFPGQIPWVLIPAQPLTTTVTLYKSLSSASVFSSVMGG